MSENVDTRHAWLSGEELETMRGRMPIVYVEAVPGAGRRRGLDHPRRAAATGDARRHASAGRSCPAGSCSTSRCAKRWCATWRRTSDRWRCPGSRRRRRRSRSPSTSPIRDRRFPRPPPARRQPGVPRADRRRLPAVARSALDLAWLTPEEVVRVRDPGRDDRAATTASSAWPSPTPAASSDPRSIAFAMTRG